MILICRGSSFISSHRNIRARFKEFVLCRSWFILSFLLFWPGEVSISMTSSFMTILVFFRSVDDFFYIRYVYDFFTEYFLCLFCYKKFLLGCFYPFCVCKVVLLYTFELLFWFSTSYSNRSLYVKFWCFSKVMFGCSYRFKYFWLLWLVGVTSI